MKPTQLLKFGKGNAKLSPLIQTFSLPAGHACPGASLCYSKTIETAKNSGKYKVQDGPNCQFRCFAASDEAKYPAVRQARWHNFNLLKAAKTVEGMVNLMLYSIATSPFKVPFRLHVAGDFFSQDYFDSWVATARLRPNFTFYAYTKSIPLWIARRHLLPDNFKLTASLGGKWDSLVKEHKLKSARVVYTIAEAEKLGLEIDHDDSHAYGDSGDFALLLHGTQPAGTEAAKAWSALKKSGIGGYWNQKNGRAKLAAGGTLPVEGQLIAA